MAHMAYNWSTYILDIGYLDMADLQNVSDIYLVALSGKCNIKGWSMIKLFPDL